MEQDADPFGSHSGLQIKVAGIDEGTAKRVFLFLILATFAMSVMGVAAVLVKHAIFTGHWTSQIQQSFIRLFNLGAEGNVPTWYSSSLLLIAALMLGWNSILAKQRRDAYRNWW